MLSTVRARFPLRHDLLATRGGRRTFFPGPGQTAALLGEAQSQPQPRLVPLANNSSSRGQRLPPTATFTPPFTPPTTKCTRGFSTSRSIEKAGVSKSDSNSNDTSDEFADCETRSAEEESAAAAHTRLVFRRLYRILFRRINQLEHALVLQRHHAAEAVDDSSVRTNNRDNHSNTTENGDPLLLLLQPPLNPHCVGSSRIIDNISDASVQQVLTLFYHWSLHAIAGGMGSNTNDDDDNENENKKDDLEDKFTTWLDAVCPDHQEHENGNKAQRRRHQYPWQENRALDTLWIRIPVLRQAVRQAFSAAVSSQPRDDGSDIQEIVKSRQFYIQASIQAYKFMSQQLAMIPLTSTSTTSSLTKMIMDDDGGGLITTYNTDDGTFVTTTNALTSDDSNKEQEQVINVNNTLIRVTTVSRWIGRSLNPSQRLATTSATGIASSSHDHHFVYRIRIENLAKNSDAESTAAASGGGGSGGTIVQLNGRSWEIESLPVNETDKDNLSLSLENQEAAAERDIVKVHAPREGAVGQHPSLGPEQAFEYYSRCDLSTPIGTMQGRFYFTIVSSPRDDSDDDNKKKDKKKIKEEAAKNRHFQVEVHPFSLRAERF